MKLPLHKELLSIPLQIYMFEKYGIDTSQCPCCKNKTLQLVKLFFPWKHAGDGRKLEAHHLKYKEMIPLF